MFSSWRIFVSYVVHEVSEPLADKHQGLIKTEHAGLFDCVDSWYHSNIKSQSTLVIHWVYSKVESTFLP